MESEGRGERGEFSGIFTKKREGYGNFQGFLPKKGRARGIFRDFYQKNFQYFKTEPFPGSKWISEINNFNRDVGNVLLCTMGTLGIAILSGSLN